MRLAVAGTIHQLKRKSLVGQIVVVFLGLELLFVGAFVDLSLPTATGGNLSNYCQNLLQVIIPQLPSSLAQEVTSRYPELLESTRQVRFSLYVPQAPIAIFLGYILGWQLAVFSSSLYLLGGIAGTLVGFHTFANGGGTHYLNEPGFGYLLGLVVASFWSGKLTDKRRTSFRQVMAVLVGVLSVHVIGLVYLTISYMFGGVVDGLPVQPEWHALILEQYRNLSGYTFGYDLLFSFLLVGIGFPLRWLVVTLTAPDIAIKLRSQPKLEDIE